MLDHHLQRGIVYHLALTRAMRFSDLKPGEIENKLFTYHLKKVITAGYVQKDEEGLYRLTSKGRRLGIRVNESTQQLIDKPESVFFLVIRRKADGSWLLYKRNTHPLIGRVGFMHAKPVLALDAPQSARLACKERVGLDCEFTVLGSGFFRVFEDSELESFTNFTLLVCENAEGELRPNDKLAGYSWQTEPNFSDETMLPNMQILSELYLKGKPFFIEKRLRINV